MRAKQTVEGFLTRVVAPVLRRGLARRHGIVLAFHNVVPSGELPAADASLHLPQDDFADQLDRLTRTHEVVPLTELHSNGTGDRPKAALTFDDGCRGMLSAGVQELVRRNLPATCFVVPGRIGGPAFWWDRWRDGPSDLSPAARALALGRLQGKDPLVDQHATGAGWIRISPPDHAAPATWEEIRTAAAYDRLDFGAHSWSHPNLTAIGGDELRKELADPLDWLAANGLRWNRWLSCPYGLSSPTVAAAAEAEGYEGALLIDRRPPGGLRTGRYATPRMNIPSGISLNGFELRAAGWPL